MTTRTMRLPGQEAALLVHKALVNLAPDGDVDIYADDGDLVLHGTSTPFWNIARALVAAFGPERLQADDFDAEEHPDLLDVEDYGCSTCDYGARIRAIDVLLDADGIERCPLQWRKKR